MPLLVKTLLGAVLMELLLQQDPIATEAMRGYKHPWADFGDASSVTMRETMRRPDIDASGKLVYKDMTTDVTWTVVAAVGEKTTFKIEGRFMFTDDFGPSEPSGFAATFGIKRYF